MISKPLPDIKSIVNDAMKLLSQSVENACIVNYIITNVIYSGKLFCVFANIITDDDLHHSFRSGTQQAKNASGQSPRATTGQQMPSSSYMTSAVSRHLTVFPSGSMRWTCTPVPRSSRILSVGCSLTTSDTVHYSHALCIHTPFNCYFCVVFKPCF